MTYHGEEQEIIDFAESPAYDSEYDDIDYDPLDWIYDGDEDYDVDVDNPLGLDYEDEPEVFPAHPVANPGRIQL